MKSKLATEKVRPRIQRAFFRWLSENKHRFAVPLRIVKRTDSEIGISLVGLNPIISISLSTGIVVCVTWENEVWDWLYCFDEAVPRRVVNGYVCKICEEAEENKILKIFQNREALWRDHLFEPFLKRLNDDLAQATDIGLYCDENRSCTWAKLIKDRQNLTSSSFQPMAVLPLWQHFP